MSIDLKTDMRQKQKKVVINEFLETGKGTSSTYFSIKPFNYQHILIINSKKFFNLLCFCTYKAYIHKLSEFYF